MSHEERQKQRQIEAQLMVRQMQERVKVPRCLLLPDSRYMQRWYVRALFRITLDRNVELLFSQGPGHTHCAYLHRFRNTV